MFILRQLEFGLFDFRLHAEFSPEQGAKILETLAEIKRQLLWCRGRRGAVSRMPSATFSPGVTRRVTTAICGPMCWRRTRIPASKKRGFSTAKPGNPSSDNILTRGGSEEPMDLFKRFRGREPQIDAMLEHYGIEG